MNKLGQAQIFAILFALIGAVMGFIMAKSMGAGLLIRMITVLCCAGAGYFIPMAAGR